MNDRLGDSSKVRARDETKTLFLGEKTLKNPFESKFDEEMSLKIKYVGDLDVNDRACGFG